MNVRKDEAPIYGIFRVGRREFVIRKSLIIDGVAYPEWPLFDPPERDEEGRPYAFVCNEKCEYFKSNDPSDPSGSSCSDCVYMNGDPIGLCMCAARRKKRKEQKP